ncbi:unnamed protein product [Brassica rapa]|uniref:Uncharacterized protein n=1 Tax=Brassica campestris TaxID=3711 RepID=A0A8D9DPZ1_BRACM|nr:unnamed protein product [Brassica rapa]
MLRHKRILDTADLLLIFIKLSETLHCFGYRKSNVESNCLLL